MISFPSILVEVKACFGRKVTCAFWVPRRLYWWTAFSVYSGQWLCRPICGSVSSEGGVTLSSIFAMVRNLNTWCARILQLSMSHHIWIDLYKLMNNGYMCSKKNSCDAPSTDQLIFVILIYDMPPACPQWIQRLVLSLEKWTPGGPKCRYTQ